MARVLRPEAARRRSVRERGRARLRRRAQGAARRRCCASPTSSSTIPLLNEETRHLIGAREFALMKPTAYFINVSRGPVVDEPALIDALRTGRIAGAALDVFEQEPVDPANPLLAMDNVIVTPHSLCWTDECFHNMATTGLAEHRRRARRAGAGVRRESRGARASARAGVARALTALRTHSRRPLLARGDRDACRRLRRAGSSRGARTRPGEHDRRVRARPRDRRHDARDGPRGHPGRRRS